MYIYIRNTYFFQSWSYCANSYLVKANVWINNYNTVHEMTEFPVQMWIQYYSGDYFYSNAASWFTKSQYESLFTTKMLRECLENT